MIKTVNLIILDSDEKRISALSSYFSEHFPENKIYYAKNGEEAYILIKDKQPCIVICEEALPSITAENILKRLIKNQIEYFYFIVLTEDKSENNVKDLLEKGFDDYIYSPDKSNVLYNRMRIADKIMSLRIEILEENQLLKKLSNELEEESNHLIEISTKFMQSRIPASYTMLEKIADKSEWIANKFPEMDEEAIKNIRIAAFYCQAGRMFLPDDLINLSVMKNGRPGHELMHQVPVVAKEIVSGIKRFSGIGNILYHIYENLDGSGIPSNLKSWEIPLESRIIRVVLDYEENRYFYNSSSKEVIEKLKSRTKRLYDPRVVSLLEQYLNENEDTLDENELSVLLSELKPGMELLRDIESGSGIMLLKSGSLLNEKLISTLITHSMSDPIYGYIYVKKEINK